MALGVSRWGRDVPKRGFGHANGTQIGPCACPENVNPISIGHHQLATSACVCDSERGTHGRQLSPEKR